MHKNVPEKKGIVGKKSNLRSHGRMVTRVLERRGLFLRGHRLSRLRCRGFFTTTFEEIDFDKGGFVRRYDGRVLKSIEPFNEIIPYVMSRRSESQVFAKQVIETEKINAYLNEKRAQGQRIKYLHLFMALYVRVIGERPQLNRFVMNSRLYARKGITISMAVKRSLQDEGEETTVKFDFTGRENIFEVARIVDETIAASDQVGSSNATDKIAAAIMSLPGIVKKTLVAVLKAMDRWNMLPRGIIDASPFHATLFFSHLKSIKLDYIYHHLYDFGTASIFVALGKTKKMAVVGDDTVVVKKCCEIGYTLDERVCDGLYFANSLKLLKKYLEDPHLLETGLEKITEDVR